jgi:hypothetical protein
MAEKVRRAREQARHTRRRVLLLQHKQDVADKEKGQCKEPSLSDRVVAAAEVKGGGVEQGSEAEREERK